MTREEFENLIDEKYAEIEEALAETKKELLEKYDEEQSDNIKAGEQYYYITSTGEIFTTWFTGKNDNLCHISIGNFFRTRAEAEFEVERLKVIHELNKYSEKNPIWNGANYHYLMEYHLEDDYISSGSRYVHKFDTIYFSSPKDIDKAIKAIGEDRIKKYYFRIGENE